MQVRRGHGICCVSWVAGVLVLAACPSAPREAASAAVARIGDTIISVGQLQRRLDDTSAPIAATATAAERRREALEAEIRFELFAQEARARGFAQHSDVQEAVQQMLVRKLTSELEGRQKASDISDAELRAHFDAHRAEYRQPERLRASAVVVPVLGDRARAQQQAEEARLRLMSGDKGGTAVSSQSYLTAEEVTRLSGASVQQWLWAGAVFEEVSPVLDGMLDGQPALHVVVRTGRRGPIAQGFDEVKGQIKSALIRERRARAFDAFVLDLQRKYPVTVYEDKLPLAVVWPAREDHPHPHVDARGVVPGVDVGRPSERP